jgi:hypothetical protein
MRKSGDTINRRPASADPRRGGAAQAQRVELVPGRPAFSYFALLFLLLQISYTRKCRQNSMINFNA